MAADQNSTYEKYRKPTRRDAFLATMEQTVPWEALSSVIEPFYPKAGNGRNTVRLEDSRLQFGLIATRRQVAAWHEPRRYWAMAPG